MIAYWFLLVFLFFFKQKTAYEIGLGIPAEPLFRSRTRRPKLRTLPTGSVDPNFGRRVRNRRQLNSLQNRSEERRVGKECRSQWSTYHKKKKKKEARNEEVVRS